MKTVAFNRSRGSLFTTLFVAGGLIALYFYRNQGGKMSTLFSKGADAVRGTRGFLATASDGTEATGSRAQEISASPESLDAIPAT